MPMPNLVEVGDNLVWQLPPGPDHPWVEDLELATQAGYSSSEVTNAITLRSRSSGKPDAGLDALQDDFFHLNCDRVNLEEDPQHTNAFLSLAGEIAHDYMFGPLTKPLVVQPWSAARTSRQLVSKDASGGFLFSQVLNNITQREKILANYADGFILNFTIEPHSFVPRKADHAVDAVANTACWTGHLLPCLHLCDARV